jgi:hypothetical protein
MAEGGLEQGVLKAQNQRNAREGSGSGIRPPGCHRASRIASRCTDRQCGGAEALDDERSKTGKFERVTGSPEQIDEALTTDNAFWIYTKDPNVQAFTDLLNRALHKLAEHVQMAGADGGSIVIRWQLDEPPALESPFQRYGDSTLRCETAPR